MNKYLYRDHKGNEKAFQSATQLLVVAQASVLDSYSVRFGLGDLIAFEALGVFE